MNEEGSQNEGDVAGHEVYSNKGEGEEMGYKCFWAICSKNWLIPKPLGFGSVF